MKSALLVIDVQQSFTHRPYWDDAELPAFSHSLQQLVNRAQQAGVPVLQVFHVDEEGQQNPFSHESGLIKTLPLQGPGEPSSRDKALNLQPGELVRVRSPAEIAATLDDRGESRGLSFDREMLPHCGRTYRVKSSVRRIIDEKDGRMLKIPKDCIILDDVYCSGELSVCGRWFCPRGIYPFWRESWVERVDDAARP